MTTVTASRAQQQTGGRRGLKQRYTSYKFNRDSPQPIAHTTTQRPNNPTERHAPACARTNLPGTISLQQQSIWSIHGTPADEITYNVMCIDNTHSHRREHAFDGDLAGSLSNTAVAAAAAAPAGRNSGGGRRRPNTAGAALCVPSLRPRRRPHHRLRRR